MRFGSFFYGMHYLGASSFYMKKALVLIVCCLFSGIIFAQDSVVVHVKVRDTRHDDPVRNAYIEVEAKNTDTAYTRTTNSYGDFYLDAVAGESLAFKLTHFKYNSEKYGRKIPSRLKTDTIVYTFTMEFIREQSIEEVVVAAPGVPVVVFDSKKLHVSDFEILNNGELILLTYPKQLKKGSRLLLYDGKNVKSSFEIEKRAEELVRDFRGNPHVVCQGAVFGVYAREKEVGIMTLEKDYFMKYVAPIVDTNKTKLYFSNFNKDYPAFDYFSFDRLDSAYTKILEIEDELMMELYRAEYKWVDVRTKLWAKNKEIQTGVDAEIWVGMNYFTQSIYYKELYAPLFHRNDTLFVFDYYKDFLRTFDADGNKLDSIPIYHHYDKRHTGWENTLIQDRVTGQVYAIFDRAGYVYLGWVDTKTGDITEQVKLEYRYAHDIQVYNNHIYYIYRPFESPQKKYLYKERLPYSFGAAQIQEGELVEK